MKLLLRVAGALAALAVAVWLAIGLRGAVLTERATARMEEALVAGQPTGPAVQGAERDLDRAAFLNPDRRARSYRAQVFAALGRDEEARELLHRVLREEPDNAEIWRTARVTGVLLDDRGLIEASVRRLRELNPHER